MCWSVAGRTASDILATIGRRRFTMPDERIQEPSADGKPTDIEPGWTAKGYHFYLSPDENWLFVERGLYHRFSVCYLYHRVSDTRMVPVHVDGLRIDDAALVRYAKHNHLSASRLRGGARMSDFWAWRDGSATVEFTVFAHHLWNTGDDRKHEPITVDGA